LWPFSSEDEARTWQEGYQADSLPSSFHLDVEMTALPVTREYLGFTDIDRVT
jgi:hypothetical protein